MAPRSDRPRSVGQRLGVAVGDLPQPDVRRPGDPPSWGQARSRPPPAEQEAKQSANQDGAERDRGERQDG